MTKNNEITCEANNSSHTCTQTERNHVPTPVKTEEHLLNFDYFLKEVQRRFDVEKHLKNVAFEFLLKKGLYEEFHHFLHDEPKSTRLEIILELYKKKA